MQASCVIVATLLLFYNIVLIPYLQIPFPGHIYNEWVLLDDNKL